MSDKPSTAAAASASFTETRRYQRRPDLTALTHIPVHLEAKLQTLLPTDPSSTGLFASEPALLDKLQKMLVQDTPDAQLRCLSSIAQLLRPPQNSTPVTSSPQRVQLLAALAQQWVFPWLMECTMRYTHKPLVSLLRGCWACDAALDAAFAQALRQQIGVWAAEMAAAASASSSASTRRHHALMHFVNCMDALMVSVQPIFPLAFAATFLDVLPLLAETLQWAVMNAVGRRDDNASSALGSVPAGSGGSDATGDDTAASSSVAPSTVFGEDLEYVRFCVRVVATHTHKHLHVLSDACNATPAGMALVARQLASVTFPVVRMLSSAILPKDVLNAAGLLLVSVLFLRRLDVVMTAHFISVACAPKTLPASSGGGGVDSVTFADTERLIQAFLSDEHALFTPLDPAGPTARAVAPVASSFTHNGRFAVFKGLLSHFSSKLLDSHHSIGFLLRQFVPKQAQPRGAYRSIVHDLIVPNAMLFAESQSEPDTRFMAIQTIDTCVRHVVAVMAMVKDEVTCAARDGSKKPRPDGTSSGAAATPKEGKKKSHNPQTQPPTKAEEGENAAAVPAATAFVSPFGDGIPIFCKLTAPLQRTLASTERIVMTLWDDPTQQVSGPLYDTYNAVLEVHQGAQEVEALFRSIAHRPAAGSSSSSSSGQTLPAPSGEDAGDDGAPPPPPVVVFHLEAALRAALAIRQDRRGKYHALLPLLKRLPREKLLVVLDEHFSKQRKQKGGSSKANAGDDEEAQVGVVGAAALCEMLIAAATNSKVCSVAGEALCDFSNILLGNTSAAASAGGGCGGIDPQAQQLWRRAVIRPLGTAMILLPPSLIGTNVSKSLALNNIIAHMLTPLIKARPQALQEVLQMVTTPRPLQQQPSGAAGTASAAAMVVNDSVQQCVVECLYRARTVGLPIEAFLTPSSFSPSNDPADTSTGSSTSARAVILAALDCMAFNTSANALGLLVLSPKGAEKVTPEQCAIVERFTVRHMHFGGDSTSRNAFIALIKKWIKRLVDSLRSSKVRLGVYQQQQGPGAASGAPSAAAAAPVAVDREAMQDEWDSYVQLVFAHACRYAARVAEHFGAGIGPQAVADGAISLERRYTAMAIFYALASELVPLVAKLDGASTASAALFSPFIVEALGRRGRSPADVCRALVLPHPSITPVLLQGFSEGWDRLRSIAIDLFERLVLATRSNIGPDTSTTAAAVAAADQPHPLTQQDIRDAFTGLRSKTLRDAEGAANILCLATLPLAADDAAFLSALPREEEEGAAGEVEQQQGTAPRALVLLRWAQRALARICRVYAAHGSNLRAVQLHLHDKPMHGLLTLCALLVRRLASSPFSSTTAAAATTLGMCCEAQLQTALMALQVSMRLVSALEASDRAAGGEGGDDDLLGLKVDCRGHVYDSSEQQQQQPAAAASAGAFARAIVNNSWLGVRTAANAIEVAASAVPVESLAQSTLTNVCSALIDTLLSTKHNGVMSKARKALKLLVGLLLRSRNPTYYTVPATILDGLLGTQGVTSENEARILRRSQGLTHAMLSVLEAEDPSVPFVLFPKALNVLLDVIHRSKAPSASTLHAAHRVNALNVMKFVFDNHIFASRIVPFIEAAFLLSAEGFRHASWAVRNSSLMLFASVLHRCIGDHPSTGGGGVNTSLHDLALRMPRGVAFVQRELTAVVEATLVHGRAVQPALFPLLLLLSMLCPDAPHVITASGSGGGGNTARRMGDVPPGCRQGAAMGGEAHQDPTSGDLHHTADGLIALVLRCRSITNIMARGASAAALTSLVPVARLGDTIHAVGEAVASSAAPSASTAGVQRRQNELHGSLMHLQRFFLHYVGTSGSTDTNPNTSGSSSSKVRLSSNHSLTVSSAVYGMVLRALAQSREAAPATAMQCPTTATLYLSLLSDVVYFYGGPGATAAASDDDDPALVEMLLSAVLHCTVSAVAHALAVQSAIHADVVAMRRAVGKFLCTVSYAVANGRFNRNDSGEGTALNQLLPDDAISKMLAADAADVCGRHLTNERSITVWAAHHITTFASMDVEWIAQQDQQQPDAEAAGRRRLAAVFATRWAAPIAAPLLQLLPRLLQAEDTQWEIARSQKLGVALRFLTEVAETADVVPLLLLQQQPKAAASRSLLEGVQEEPHIAVRAWGMLLVTRLLVAASQTGAASVVSMQPWLQATLDRSAAPSSAIECRLAAVSTIDMLLVSGAPGGRPLVTLPVAAVLFRLLGDDDSQVREAAAVVATRLTTTTAATAAGGTFVRCQFSCCEALSAWIRSRGEQQPQQHELVARIILGTSLAEADADAVDRPTANGGGTAAAGDDDGEEGGDGDDDVLFEAESDNQYAERAVLLAWLTCMGCPDAAVAAASGGDAAAMSVALPLHTD